MVKTDDLISVIIPTYNRPELLKRAIKSVLAQTYDKIEIIVVDNCKENRVEHVVQSINDHRLKYYFNEIKGPSAARNMGISVASGKYIAFLDDDDEFISNKMELQLKKIYPKTKYMWTFGAGQIIKKRSIQVYRPKYKFFSNFLLGVYCQILMPSVLIRSECLGNELFDNSMFFAEDWDLWYRISRKYPVKATDDMVYKAHYEHEDERLTQKERIIEGISNFKTRHFKKLNIFQKALFIIKQNNEIDGHR